MTSESTPPSDETLIESLRKGDQTATDELTRRYWAPLHRFCASYLGDDALAEDVVQETFSKIATTTELPAGSARPWLYKVARNRCLDILRRHQRSPTHNRLIRTGFDAAQSTAGPHTRVAREERAEIIRQIIAQMPPEYREVLMLKHFDGFSREEMAQTLGITETAVKGRLVRASEFLRERLEGLSGTNP